MRQRVIRLLGDRFTPGRNRLIALPAVAQGQAKVVIRVGKFRSNGDGPANEIQRDVVAAALPCQNPQKMQASTCSGLLTQNRSIQSLASLNRPAS